MTTSVLESRGNIIENQQFTDPTTLDFVMRTRFETESNLDEVKRILNSGLGKFNPELNFRPTSQKKRALVLVTKESHCLRDLLYLQELGELPIDIPAVISNHGDLKALTESHSIKYLDQSGKDKSATEKEIRELIDKEKIDLIILARYMQILSTDFCKDFAGKIINIHHSFLPGFKGAKPYHQAHDRGVKIIGATAHFVTHELDEGPIIDQDVAHVTHAASPEDLIATGRDIERRVLSRAVKDFAEDRIFIVGDKTVVFKN
jgi:formyltetrahydrofolate deformylase